jgi:hypothetical protein
MSTPRQEKFRQAALSYLAYGCLYLAGALYLAGVGVGGRTARPGSGLVWFVLGGILVVLVPWLINKGYVWFTRLLVLLVLFRAVGLVRVMLRPAIPIVPLPGGVELPMSAGAFAFLLVTLGTAYMLARAGWDLRP